MALSGPRLAVTNRTPESWWLFLANSWPYQIRVLVALSGPRLAATNRTAESWWLFLAKSWPQQIVLPSLGGSFWPTFDRNKSSCRVLVALSGQVLAVTNRTAESWWLILWPNSWPQQIVLPSLGGSFLPTLGRNKSHGGSFWPTFGRNKSYCRVLVALSGQLLAVTTRTAESWWLFLAHVCRNKSYFRVLVALSGQLLAVTNRTAESWWLFLWPNSWPQQIVLPSLRGSFLPTLGRNKSHGGSFWPTLGRNKSYCRVLVALSGQLLAVTNRTAESWWLFLANSWP